MRSIFLLYRTNFPIKLKIICYAPTFATFILSAFYSIIPDAIIISETVRIRIDAIDVIVGSISERTPSHIIFGSVEFLVLHKNIDITSSSNYVAKANNPPDNNAGLIQVQP